MKTATEHCRLVAGRVTTSHVLSEALREKHTTPCRQATVERGRPNKKGAVHSQYTVVGHHHTTVATSRERGQ